MTIAEENYIKSRDNKSDINEHMPTLLKYAKECKHITEMGVRDIVSTWAFLYSKPTKLVCYDIYKPKKNLDLLYDSAKEEGIKFSFILKNVLDVTLDETDLLFIDTWHKYGQLKLELKLHSNSVRKYIILHDTTKFESQDEPGRGGKYSDERTDTPGKQGLWLAVTEFLEDNKDWKLKERFLNCNGLTVLERV